MCGINGLIGLDIQIRQEILSEMNFAIQHRGPDAKGELHHQNCSLGHLRLSILDLSEHANQPMETERFAMVYNGEVYNFPELRAELGLICSTQSDTEVILKGYEKIGNAIFSKLNGMFAIAILDKQTQEVVLVRDRLGIKPIYLYQKNNIIAFSSELKALKKLQNFGFAFTINPKAISNFFHLGYIPSPLTIYKEITKFPNGCYAQINQSKIQYTKYWDIESKISKEVLSNEKEAITQLDALINSSVQFRLRSDVPFGTFLSGGIDSSLVTAVAQKNTTHNLQTFSIGFQEQSHNEAQYAAKVAKHLRTQHEEFIVSHQEAIDIIPQIVDIYDEPYADSSAIPTMMVSKLARNKVKMTLSGDGGDELFMGYGFYNWANRLNNPLIKLGRLPISKILSMGNNRMKRAALVFDYPANDVQSHIFSQEQYYFSQSEIQNLLKNNSGILPELNAEVKSPRTLSAKEKQSFFDMQYYLKDDLLTKVDIATMKHSLETRVPLLDYRIVEFALNLSEDLKFKNGEAKYLLKQVLYQYVPKEFFDRPKQGFSIPLGKWLKKELSYLMEEYLSEEKLKQSEYLNATFVQKLVARFKNGEDYLYTKIWALIVFQDWILKNK